MTSLDLANIALLAYVALFGSSLIAVYKVFFDKFLPPGIEFSEDICSRIRGGLAVKLADCCRPFLDSKKHDVGDISLYGADDKPLEKSYFGYSPAIDSEEFKETFQSFLNDEKREFSRYWTALSAKRRLQFLWSSIRIFVACWMVLSLVAILVFGAWSKCKFPIPELPWTIATIVITGWPIFGFAGCLIPYAICSNCLAMAED